MKNAWQPTVEEIALVDVMGEQLFNLHMDSVREAPLNHNVESCPFCDILTAIVPVSHYDYVTRRSIKAVLDALESIGISPRHNIEIPLEILE